MPVENKVLIEEIAALDYFETEEEEEEREKEKEGEKEKEEELEKEEEGEEKKEEKEEEETEETEEDKKESEETKEGKEDESDKDKIPEDQKDLSQIDRLLAEVNRLSGLVGESPSTSSLSPPVAKEGEEKKIDKVDDTLPYNFMKDLDMDDVSSDPSVFNKILHSVIAKVQQQTTEQILKNIPQMMTGQISQQMDFRTMVDSFYTDNPDLANVRHVVKACAQQLHADNPNWEMTEIFANTAKKTRETLGISELKSESESKSSDGKIPSAEEAAFAKPGSSSKSNQKQQRSSLQRQIDEL